MGDFIHHGLENVDLRLFESVWSLLLLLLVGCVDCFGEFVLLDVE